MSISVYDVEQWQLWYQGWPVMKGGPGSGHRGHAGRPGKHGGSAPGGRVSVSVGKGTPLGDYGLGERDLEDLFVLPSGYRTELHVEEGEWASTGDRLLVASAKFSTDTGEKVGRAEYYFWPGTCHMDYMSMEKQAAGLGGELVERQVTILRGRGYREFTLQADNVGRYAWAKRGFEYAHPEIMAPRATERYKAWAGNLGIKPPAGGWPTFRSAADVAGYDTGRRIRGSQISNVDIARDESYPLGKAFMLDMGSLGHGQWSARLDLGP